MILRNPSSFSGHWHLDSDPCRNHFKLLVSKNIADFGHNIFQSLIFTIAIGRLCTNSFDCLQMHGKMNSHRDDIRCSSISIWDSLTILAKWIYIQKVFTQSESQKNASDDFMQKINLFGFIFVMRFHELCKKLKKITASSERIFWHYWRTKWFVIFFWSSRHVTSLNVANEEKFNAPTRAQHDFSTIHIHTHICDYMRYVWTNV